MTDWFRSWHGAPTDIKWLAVARRANVAPGMVVAVAWQLMDRASQAEERGSIEGYDAEELAIFNGCEPEQVEAIVQAMEDRGIIRDGRLSAWDRRQPKREDNSAERTRAYRERKKREETGGDAPKRAVTQRDAPEQSRTDTEQNRAEVEAHASARPFPSDGVKGLNGKGEEPEPPAPKPKPARGSRLPEQWEPPPEDWQMAVEILGTEDAARSQLDRFRDHWAAQPGQRGVKLDWSATWRNWVRKAPEFGPGPRGSPASPADKAKERKLIERYLNNGDH